jgi:outer membrane protein
MNGFKLVLASAVAVAALVSGAANAQGNLKIGVINVGRLLEQSPQTESVTKKLQDEFAPRQRDITAMRQKLQTQQETFQRDAPVMGEDERLSLERQIRDAQRELQRTENEYLEDLNIRRNEEVGKLQREVLQRVQEYARAQQYDLVIADAIFVSTAVDITDEVLTALRPGGAAPPAGGARPGGAATPPAGGASGGRSR